MREVEAEQAAGDDLEGQPHHFRVDVASLTWLPCCDRALGFLGHHRCIGVEALLVEGRQHQLALVQPAVTVGEQKAARQQRRHDAREVSLAEVGAASEHHLGGELGAAHDQNVFSAKADVDHIRRFGTALQKRQPVLLKLPEGTRSQRPAPGDLQRSYSDGHGTGARKAASATSQGAVLGRVVEQLD